MTRDDLSVGHMLFTRAHGASHAALEKRLLGSDSRGQSFRINGTRGVVPHPFNFHTAIRLHDLSPHHAACVRTVVAMVAGLGFKSDEVTTRLNPLTEMGIGTVLMQMALDLEDVGTAYLEVVRDPETRVITGLHHMPAKHTFKVLDGPRSGDYHYAYLPHEVRLARSGDLYLYDFAQESQPAVFARFGDADRFAARVGSSRVLSAETMLARRRIGIGNAVPHVDFGEVIVIQDPTNRWEHYGAPQWIGAQPYMDLSCKHLQRTCDYMHNRGTPDHLLMLFGVNVNAQQRAALEGCMGAGRGRNYGRSATIAFPAANPQTASAQLERFSDGVDGASFRDMNDSTALAICTAHRMPPMLAGISVPRPIGSANELVQALVLTQFLRAGPTQSLVEQRLACTLGERGLGIPGMNAESFTLANILEDTEITALDTLARQRDTSMTRDNSEGLRR